MKALIMIPAYNPDRDLISYVRQLKEHDLNDILVVDDGSRASCREIFDCLERELSCRVFRHAINLGKGRAIKNGFNQFLNDPRIDEYCGVITVDSDGQHAVDDVLRMADAMVSNPYALYLGCRTFSSDHVPWKSKFGNQITRGVFRVLYGAKISDTQTGLRGYPTSIIPKIIELQGERFEYETSMLIEAKLKNIPLEEIPIETIYINGNAETHFRPVQDALLIYGLIFKSFFKFMISGLASFAVDLGLFRATTAILHGTAMSSNYIILVATIFARIFSSLFNYYCNKNLVFQNESGTASIFKYYSLCFCQMLGSAAGVAALYNLLQIDEAIIKIIVDTLLFLVSYQIQHRWVFKTV